MLNNNLKTDKQKTCNSSVEEVQMQCPYCKEQIKKTDKICPYCEGKIESNSIPIFTYATYFLLFINAMLPYWLNNTTLGNLFMQHAISSKKSYEDFISTIIGFFVMSSIPAIVGILKDYRKRFFIICITVLFIFCIINLTILFTSN